MSHRGKVWLAFLITAVALATLPFGSLMAQAHEKTFQSNLTLHYDKHDDTFNGHLGTAEVCKGDRTVTVERLEGGSPGAALTDHSGQWGPIDNSTGPGTYIATVDAVDRGGYGDPVHCEAGVSHAVTVP
jgi:hypothetical protein